VQRFSFNLGLAVLALATVSLATGACAQTANSFNPTHIMLQCPVCRARQPLQIECRRCGADLELFTRAIRAVENIRAELERNLNSGIDAKITKAIRRRLVWLSPAAMRQFDIQATHTPADLE